MIVKSAKRQLSKPVTKSKPLKPEHLKLIIDKYLGLDHLNESNFNVLIDKWQIVAKTVLKFYCLARFEEVVELKRSQFEFLQNGTLKVTFLKAKNNQFHDSKATYISPSDNLRYCPVNIIKKYFLRINSSLDFYFVPRIAYKKVFLLEKTSYMYCLTKYRAVLRDIGVNDFLDYGEHSDKSGGLSAALNAGCDLYSLQRHGRWKSDQVLKQYHEQSFSLRTKVSNILNGM